MCITVHHKSQFRNMHVYSRVVHFITKNRGRFPITNLACVSITFLGSCIVSRLRNWVNFGSGWDKINVPELWMQLIVSGVPIGQVQYQFLWLIILKLNGSGGEREGSASFGAKLMGDVQQLEGLL